MTKGKQLLVTGIVIFLAGWLLLARFSFGGDTCLMVSVRCESLWATRILLKMGADPNIWSRSQYPDVRRDNLKANREASYSGHTPLIVAVKQGRADIVEVLLNHGADVNVVDDSNLTPLAHGVFAEKKRALDVVQKLLAHGAEVKDLGYPVLILYSGNGNDEVVKLLLQNGADINVRAEDGTTALMNAVKWRNCTTAAILLVHSANPNLRDNAGRTAAEINESTHGCEGATPPVSQQLLRY